MEYSFFVNEKKDVEPTNPDDAKAALASVDRLSSAGLKRGLYPRKFALLLSLWAGVLAATVGMAIWPLVFVAGLFGHHFWRRRSGAWIREIGSRRDFWVVMVLSMVFGGLFVIGYVGRYDYGLTWLPVVTGAVVAIGVYATTEVAYGSVRARIKRGENS